ncbi:MAG: response regulator, partial [Deferrisomatales bacterium]
LLCRSGTGGPLAVPLDLVTRIERVTGGAIGRAGGRPVLPYQGGTLPLITPHEVAPVAPLGEGDELTVLVIALPDRQVGLLVNGPVDAYQGDAAIDRRTLRGPGVAGSTLIDGQTALVLDVLEMARAVYPGWFRTPEGEAAPRPAGARSGKTVLLAEDSAFFRGQVADLLTEAGHRVLEAEDGAQAWDLLERLGGEVDLVLTDLEMPNLDGLALTRRIRAHPELGRLPVVALTSQTGDADRERGRRAGVDEYQAKLDRDRLSQAVETLLRRAPGAAGADHPTERGSAT